MHLADHASGGAPLVHPRALRDGPWALPDERLGSALSAVIGNRLAAAPLPASLAS